MSTSKPPPPLGEEHPMVVGIPSLASVAPSLHPKNANVQLESDGKSAAAGLTVDALAAKDAAEGGASSVARKVRERDEDNLSEISDDADEILNRQEVSETHECDT